MREITQQAQNNVKIVGKLMDVSFAEGTLKDGRAYERANMTIRVNQSWFDREETSEVTVGMFATRYTSTNKVNPVWDQMQALHGFKTYQNCGEGADTVRISGCSLRENNFVSRSGQLINGYQLNASFVSNTTSAKDIASFEADVFILDMHEELDRNDEPTGRLVVRGGIVQYGGKLDVLEFIAEDPNIIDLINRSWNVNDTVYLGGRIRVTSVEEKAVSSGDSWGEDLGGTTTKFVRELILTSGKPAYEEEFAYAPADIKKAFNVRKAAIEQMQVDARAAKPAASAAKPAATTKYDWE